MFSVSALASTSESNLRFRVPPPVTSRLSEEAFTEGRAGASDVHLGRLSLETIAKETINTSQSGECLSSVSVRDMFSQRSESSRDTGDRQPVDDLSTLMIKGATNLRNARLEAEEEVSN